MKNNKRASRQEGRCRLPSRPQVNSVQLGLIHTTLVLPMVEYWVNAPLVVEIEHTSRDEMRVPWSMP
jgi:hypothetical protein